MLKHIAKLAAAGLGIFAVAYLATRTVRKMPPLPTEDGFARLFGDVLRPPWAAPHQIVPRLELTPGMQVLEVGPGNGVFTLPVAQAIGTEGRLYSVVLQPAMMAVARSRVEEAGLDNVEVRSGEITKLDLADDSLDLVICIAVLGEVRDKARALAEICRVLRPGGRLSVTEFLPDPDYSRRCTTIQRARAAGLKLTSEHGSFFMYTVNFCKPIGT